MGAASLWSGAEVGTIKRLKATRLVIIITGTNNNDDNNGIRADTNRVNVGLLNIMIELGSRRNWSNLQELLQFAVSLAELWLLIRKG